MVSPLSPFIALPSSTDEDACQQSDRNSENETSYWSSSGWFPGNCSAHWAGHVGWSVLIATLVEMDTIDNDGSIVFDRLASRQY